MEKTQDVAQQNVRVRALVSAETAQALLVGIEEDWHGCSANDGRCSCRLVWGAGAPVAKVLCCEDPDAEGEGYTPEAAYRHVRLIEAAPALAYTVVCLSLLTRQLSDLLDCERGVRAPEGWTWKDGEWVRGLRYVARGGRHDWVLGHIVEGVPYVDSRHPYALEAIETAHAE